MANPEGCMDATLMLIDERKIIEDPDGETILPSPHKLINVCLDEKWLNQAIQAQRNCEMAGEPFVIRLLSDADPLTAPIYAVAVLTLPVKFGAIYTTGGRN